jgi:hypothetical protein
MTISKAVQKTAKELSFALDPEEEPGEKRTERELASTASRNAARS